MLSRLRPKYQGLVHVVKIHQYHQLLPATANACAGTVFHSRAVAGGSGSSYGRSGRQYRTFATSIPEAAPLQKTALYEFHQTMGGDMVSFAGYSLPIMYKGVPESSGIMNEHLWCRSPGKASIFDVSHMGQVRLRGSDRVKFLETLVVGDIQGLGEGDSCLSLLTNPNGGIIDDTVITNVGDVIDMVINGATKDTDLEIGRAHV